MNVLSMILGTVAQCGSNDCLLSAKFPSLVPYPHPSLSKEEMQRHTPLKGIDSNPCGNYFDLVIRPYLAARNPGKCSLIG